MKKLIGCFLMVIVAGVLFASCTQPEKFVVKLEGDPTTGYNWTYSAEPSGIVKQVTSDYVSEDTGLVGSDGEFVFVFEGVKEGDVQLVFEYAREWEEDTPPTRTVVYDLSVDKNKNITQNSVEDTGEQAANS